MCTLTGSIDTFIQFPQTTITVLNGNGDDHVLKSFLRCNNITSYTNDDFDAQILSITKQLLPADLATPVFGIANTSLDIRTKDDIFQNILMGKFDKYIRDELFETLCPCLINNPSDALDCVSQEVTDAMGNGTRLTIHAYFTNLFNALTCMPGHIDKDVCLYAVENLCEDVRDHLELTYRSHCQQYPHDKYTQMRTLQILKIQCTLSEKHVYNLSVMLSSSTANALLVNNANLAINIPGLSTTVAADAAALACSSISCASPHPVFASQA